MLKGLGLTVVVVRNKVEMYVGKPDLKRIEDEDSAVAIANGANAWTCASSLSRYNVDSLKEVIYSALKKATGRI
jgi:hypothetical protein